MKKILSLLLLSGLLVTGCSKLQFDDPSTLTNEEAFEKVKDLGLKLATGAVQTVFWNSTNVEGIFYGGFSDQNSTTNRYQEFWDACEEPRKRINNSNSYGGYSWMINLAYANFYQANLDATLVLDAIEVNGKQVLDAQGNDRTSDCQIAAHYAKGVAQGYIGAIYDKGIIVDDAGVTTRDLPNSYKEMIENAMIHFDQAISLANAASTFNFDFLANGPITKSDFIKLCNSMAARLLASVPRSKSEAAALGASFWNKVEAYAGNGFTTSNFLITAVQDGYYHNLYDWCNYRLSDGAGYIPVDIKLAWLVSGGTHPKYYPSSGVLPPVTTSDDRFYEYYGYDPDFGYLRSDRNRGLFTNYYRVRWDYNGNQWMGEPGTPNPYFLAEEIRLLRAEAKFYAGDIPGAALLLNDPAARRISEGNLGPVLATEAEVRHALHYEYSVEIDLAASVIHPWAFMRRHDLLIGGTPTQVPNPQQQLDLLNKPIYSFGGKANFGETGDFGEVATAANVGWKQSE